MCLLLCITVRKRRMIMPTNLALDDNLIIEAQKLGGHKTKKDAVNQALKQYIQFKKQLRVMKLFGQIEFDSSYDYKKQRRLS